MASVLKAFLILDFDSTFVSVEALVELAEIALRDAPDREQKVAQIDGITRAGMEGRISFDESLRRRLGTLQPTRAQLEALVDSLKQKVTPSVAGRRDWIAENAERIYIISGGFQEFVVPVAAEFGIGADHVLANSFEWRDGRVSGVKPHALTRDDGKARALKELGLARPVVMVGDARSDYETRKAGVADAFVAFVENTERPGIAAVADKVVHSFDELVELLESRNQLLLSQF